MDDETIEGNCVRCGRSTRHAVRSGGERSEYYECVLCGNRVDAKAFVYDNLDALSAPGRTSRRTRAPRRASNRRRGARARPGA